MPYSARSVTGAFNAAQSLDRALGGGDQLVVEHHAHPFAAGDEVQHPFIALVAMLAQDQILHAELHPFGIVGATFHVRPFATFVINRYHLRLVGLDQINARDQPQPLGRQRDRVPPFRLYRPVSSLSRIRRLKQSTTQVTVATKKNRAVNDVGEAEP